MVQNNGKVEARWACGWDWNLTGIRDFRSVIEPIFAIRDPCVHFIGMNKKKTCVLPAFLERS